MKNSVDIYRIAFAVSEFMVDFDRLFTNNSNPKGLMIRKGFKVEKKFETENPKRAFVVVKPYGWSKKDKISLQLVQDKLGESGSWMVDAGGLFFGSNQNPALKFFPTNIIKSLPFSAERSFYGYAILGRGTTERELVNALIALK